MLNIVRSQPVARRRPAEAGNDRDARPLRPPLKWAGGKRWLAPRLHPIWHAHQHRRLVEPFCGGLSVTLALTPARALLNDINPHVINFYRWLQRGLSIATPLANTRKAYNALRA